MKTKNSTDLVVALFDCIPIPGFLPWCLLPDSIANWFNVSPSSWASLPSLAFVALNSWEPDWGRPGPCSAFLPSALSNPSIQNFLFKCLNFPLADLHSLKNISAKDSATLTLPWSCLPPSFLSLKYRTLVFNFWVSQWCPSAPHWRADRHMVKQDLWFLLQ